MLLGGSNGYYYGFPSIADINGDFVEGVLISDSCGNPREHSHVNGWTTPVWQAAGCATVPPISSDLVISRWFLDGSIDRIMMVEGDQSCYTNVWHCPALPTPISFDENQTRPRVYYSKGYIKIENYRGTLAIYNVQGRKIFESKVDNKGSFSVSKGIYIVKVGNETFKILASD